MRVCVHADAPLPASLTRINGKQAEVLRAISAFGSGVHHYVHMPASVHNAGGRGETARVPARDGILTFGLKCMHVPARLHSLKLRDKRIFEREGVALAR